MSIKKIKIGSTEHELIASGLTNESVEKTKLNYTNIAYGTCSTAADAAEKAVAISGNTNWTLTTGSLIAIKFTYTNSASNVKLNVNSTGAYPIWYNNAEYTGNGNAYTGYANRVTTYMFNGTHWVWISNGYDANSTYSNASLGQGYATHSNTASGTANTATLSSYSLSTGGIVSVKFKYDVPASATLNINGKGAKSIYYRGAAITGGVIKAGDVATFIYSSQYHLISIDRWQNDIVGIKTALDTLDSSYDAHKHTVSHTPAGTVSKPTFTGSAATSGAPSATATVASSTHTHKYTPAGTVSTPTFTGSAVTSDAPSGTTSVYSITGVGSVPSLSASVSNKCLTFTFSAGSVPTRSSVTVASSAHTHSVTASGTVSQPTFTGTEASTTSISGTTKVGSEAHTHSVTAKGSVSQPTFTGTAATIDTGTPK